MENLHDVFLNLASFQPKWLSLDCSDATFVFVSSENPILYSNVFFSIFLYKINFCQVGDDVFVNRTLTWQPISPPSVRPLFTFHQSWGCLIDQTVRCDQAEAQTPHCGGHSQWGCGTCDSDRPRLQPRAYGEGLKITPALVFVVTLFGHDSRQ